MELSEKLHFYLPFAKTIGRNYDIAAKMARIFHVKTTKRIGIFLKYLQDWHE